MSAITHPSTEDPISTTVQIVGAELRGALPWQRRDLLAEIRSGLEDAASAYEQSGLMRDEAARRAVEDFGPARPVGREMAQVVAMRATRWTAIGLGPGYLLMLAGWWLLSGSDGGSARGGFADLMHRIAVTSFDWLALLALVGAAAAMVVGRRNESPARTLIAARIAGACGLVCVLLTWVASYFADPWSLLSGRTVPMTPLEVFSLVITAVIFCCSLQAWRAGRAVARKPHRTRPWAVF